MVVFLKQGGAVQKGLTSVVVQMRGKYSKQPLRQIAVHAC